MRNLLALPGLAVIGLMALGEPIADTRPLDWNVDARHTEINFSVRHFFTPVTGSFGDYEIDLDFDPEYPEKSSVRVKVAVASVDTGNEKRDNHLRSADWFDAEKYAYLTFESSSVKRVAENQFLAKGTLAIKDVKQQIELPITLLGVQEIPEQMREMLGGVGRVASFETKAELDRRDFGVGVGSWAETAIVGPGVDITIVVEANRP
jgi:polyisoprenoid-binding protein YceI